MKGLGWLGFLPSQPTHMKKHILPNGIAVDQAATLPSPLRGGSQTGSHRPGCRPSDSRRKWGLHLVRRNGVFYFRRRWRTPLRKNGAPEFLSVSLRTNILSEAVKRSCSAKKMLARKRSLFVSIIIRSISYALQEIASGDPLDAQRRFP